MVFLPYTRETSAATQRWGHARNLFAEESAASAEYDEAVLT